MNAGITLLQANVGMQIELIILLCLVIGSLIIYAIKFEAGNIFLFITTAVTFVLEYEAKWDYTYTLIVFFISLVLMSLSLLFQDRTSAGVVP